jgi:hypothetical protein
MFHTKPRDSAEREGLMSQSGSAEREDMDKRFILTTNKRGQVTFPKEVMEHCGLPSGGNLKVEFLPDGICKFSPIHPRSPAKASHDPPSSAAGAAESGR